MTIPETILFSGDFSPRGSMDKIITEGHCFDLIAPLKELFAETDFHITNLEAPFNFGNESIGKTGPALSLNLRAIDLLFAAKINIACLANNHIMDKGAAGLLTSITYLQKHGILYVGAGENLEQAGKVIYFGNGETKFGLINACENEFNIASEKTAGAFEINPISLHTKIKEAKENCNLLFVVLHGGSEYFPYPPPEFKEICRFLADCGANAVICHHNHAPSCYEYYNGVPIFYGLGNFLFEYGKNNPPSWYEGFFVKFTVLQKKIAKFDIIPYKQNYGVAGLVALTREENVLFCKKMENLNKILQDQEAYYRVWQEFCGKNAKSYLSLVYGLNKWQKFKHKFLKSKLHTFIPSQKRKILTNLIRCSSHRQVLKTILEDDRL